MSDAITEEEVEANKFMEFNLGDEHYAIPLLRVREVISVPEVTPIPRAPGYFNGIMNLRGQIISVMDLRKKLGVDASENNSNEAVIILDYVNFRLGVVVDSINRVLLVDQSEMKTVPVTKSTVKADYIDAVFEKGTDLVVLVNIGKALSIEDLEIMDQKETAA